jgi:hypothetical protein
MSKRPRNAFILFNQEWAPIISEEIKIIGGTGQDYQKKMSETWSKMKEKETVAYVNYNNRSKHESKVYQLKKK